MRLRPATSQQAIAGLAVVLIIVATLLGGLILALGERPISETEAAEMPPTPTAIRLATLPPATQTSASPTPTSIVPTASPRSPTATNPAPAQASPTPRTTTRPTTAPPRPAATPCTPSSDWVTYRVQVGENLYRIGLRYGQTVSQMVAANCLSSENVYAGQSILVPPVTPQAGAAANIPAQGGIPLVATERPGPTPTQSATDGACTDPDSIINSPGVGAVLSGTITITGTARLENFSFYKLEIRQEGTGEPYVTFYTGDTEVVSGTLAQFNTTPYPDGEYWIRLVVVNDTNNYPERCAILVVFDN